MHIYDVDLFVHTYTHTYVYAYVYDYTFVNKSERKSSISNVTCKKVNELPHTGLK